MASRSKQQLAMFKVIKKSIIGVLKSFEAFLEEDVIYEEKTKKSN